MKTRSLTMLLVGTLLCTPLSAQSTQPTPPTQPTLHTQKDLLSENYTPRKGWPKVNKKLYLEIRGGYGFQMGGERRELRGTGTVPTLYGYDPKQNKGTKLSLGEGWQVGLNVGYQFNRYMAAEVGFSLWYGTNSEPSPMYFPCDSTGRVYRHPLYGHPLNDRELSKLSSDGVIEITNLGYLYIKERFKSNGRCLTASFRVSPGFKRWDPYLKVGVNLMNATVYYTHAQGMNDRGEIDNLRYYANGFTNGETGRNATWDGYSRGAHLKFGIMSMGVTTAVGVMCRLTPMVAIFAEWQTTLMTTSVYRNKIVDMSEVYGSTEYRPVFENAFGNAYIRDFVFPFSNIGLNWGMKFSF